MTLGANFVEARIFLVPQVMVFLPAFLLTFGYEPLFKPLSMKGKLT
jgi:hypothetical protein